MIASVDFSKFTDVKGDNLVFEAFVDGLEDNPDNQQYIMLDCDSYTVWYMWYSEVLM